MPVVKFDPRHNESCIESGGPSYIKCKPFSIPESFSSREVVEGKPLTRNRQKEFTTYMMEDSPGWVTFVTGPNDMVRLFSWYVFQLRTLTKGVKGNWVRVHGGRYHDEAEKSADITVVDSVLTHSIDKRDALTYDPVRIGKVFDICNTLRGWGSSLVMCPGLTVETATRLLRVDPDMAISLKRSTQGGNY